MTTASRLALAAAVLTPLLGVGYLMQVTYIAEQCFRTAFFGGCTNLRTDLSGMLGVAPLQLVAPFALVLVTTALAMGAWIASPTDRDGRRVAACTAGYAMLAAPLTLVVGPIFVAPFLLLIASTLLGSGAKPREVALTLAKGTVVVIGAFAAALAAIALWGVRHGVMPLGGPQAVWLYVGLATALGIAAGCLAVASRGEARALLRALVLAYAGFGAGAVGASLTLFPTMYAHGRYVGLGLGAVWLSAWTLLATDVIAGVVVWRVGGGLPWRRAAAATGLCAIAFVLAAILTVGVATRIVAGDVGPPLPLLPSTSTSK
jgi:hypothetical protein